MSDFGFYDGSQRFQNIASALVVSAGANPAFGAWTQLTASSPFQASAIWLLPFFGGSAGAPAAASWNIGIGPSGSPQIIVPNLAVCTGYDAAGLLDDYRRYPVDIPAGSAIYAQVAASDSSTNMQLYAMLEGGGIKNPSIGGNITAYGMSSNTTGTGVALPTSGSTAWTQITAATTQDIKQAILNLQYVSNVAGRYTLDLGIGPSGSEQVMVPTLPFITRAGSSTNGDNLSPSFLALPVSIPKGTRISFRVNWVGGTGTNPIYASIQGFC
ncbi:MAG: hypothetical protein KGL39_50695 [Patescibacteria group bacterium]|nr:hypothetical protein [Patescibacteria group bacterium]